MLFKAKTLSGYRLDSLDGEIGHVKEFYFDDQYWGIRYLVADTGSWLTGRKVLISPYALDNVSEVDHHIKIDLTKRQIEDSPSIVTNEPVSRQFEDDYYGYYGWPVYWGGPYMWGYYPNVIRDHEKWGQPTDREKAWDPHLRSTNDVRSHLIEASDGEIGHVSDFIIDDKSWAIRYLVVNTKNWMPGKHVLIAPHWIKQISWGQSKVFVNLTRDAIEHAPEYTSTSALTRDYEAELHRHYDRPTYWSDDPVALEYSR
jgi:uncharacterized protein YrrD